MLKARETQHACLGVHYGFFVIIMSQTTALASNQCDGKNWENCGGWLLNYRFFFSLSYCKGIYLHTRIIQMLIRASLIRACLDQERCQQLQHIPLSN